MKFSIKDFFSKCEQIRRKLGSEKFEPKLCLLNLTLFANMNTLGPNFSKKQNSKKYIKNKCNARKKAFG